MGENRAGKFRVSSRSVEKPPHVRPFPAEEPGVVLDFSVRHVRPPFAGSGEAPEVVPDRGGRDQRRDDDSGRENEGGHTFADERPAQGVTHEPSEGEAKGCRGMSAD